jgi:hypothetical protein
MTKEIVLEVIEKLIGKINPMADAAFDSDRLKNLKLFIEVCDEMNTMIDDIAYKHKDTKYGSVKPLH